MRDIYRVEVERADSDMMSVADLQRVDRALGGRHVVRGASRGSLEARVRDFNTEANAGRCADSARAQLGSDFEVIELLIPRG